MTKYRPTPEDSRAIRRCSEREASSERVTIRPSLRHNTRTERGWNMNVRLVSDDPKWEDTDLFGTVTWTDFVEKGIELTADGRGLVDFLVYDRDTDELATHVQAHIEDGKLVLITDAFKALWPA